MLGLRVVGSAVEGPVVHLPKARVAGNAAPGGVCQRGVVEVERAGELSEDAEQDLGGKCGDESGRGNGRRRS